MDEHWTEIGRDLLQGTAKLGKWDRLALVRKRAHELDRSPHSVGRFLALAEFLAEQKIDTATQVSLPLGVVEVIHRASLKDPFTARAMLDEAIQKGMTYRDALKRVGVLTKASEDSSEDVNFRPEPYIFSEIINRLGGYSVTDLKFVCLGGYKQFLSSVSSSWKVKDLDLALLSEGDTIYSFSRGFKNFARNIFLATNEYDHVLVDFISQESLDSFLRYCHLIERPLARTIKVHVVADDRLNPNRKGWAHLRSMERMK